MTRDGRPVVWITGASRGIGEAIAKAFGGIGASVAVSGRSMSSLRRVAAQIRRKGGEVVPVVADVRRERSVRTAHNLIVARLGPVDVLVNNAGVTAFEAFNRTSVRTFRDITNTNLVGMFIATRAVLPGMIHRRSGVVINVNSVAATTTFLDSAAYAASKAGALALSRGLRAEIRRFGIRVIDVLPGAVDTSMWSLADRRKNRKRMMKPAEIADIIVSVYCQSENVHIEEIVVRPLNGDL